MQVQKRELLLMQFYNISNQCSMSIIWNPVVGHMNLIITATCIFISNCSYSYKYNQMAESQLCFCSSVVSAIVVQREGSCGTHAISLSRVGSF